jgi:hypothetical protein
MLSLLLSGVNLLHIRKVFKVEFQDHKIADVVRYQLISRLYLTATTT